MAKDNDLVRRIELIDRGWGHDLQAEHGPLLDGVIIQIHVVPVQIDGSAERALGGGNPGDVIDVSVGEEHVPNSEFAPLHKGQQPRHLIPWINQHSLAGALAGDDEAVLEKRADGLRLDYDHSVILAILDDLLFTSKIRTTAAHLGVPVVFSRSSTAALEEMRKTPPTLVILDLSNPRIDALGIVAAMKVDEGLAAVRTVGYASHVQGDVIDAARRAGVGEVLARSVFTQRLAELLAQRGA